MYSKTACSNFVIRLSSIKNQWMTDYQVTNKYWNNTLALLLVVTKFEVYKPTAYFWKSLLDSLELFCWVVYMINKLRPIIQSSCRKIQQIMYSLSPFYYFTFKSTLMLPTLQNSWNVCHKKTYPRKDILIRNLVISIHSLTNYTILYYHKH